MFKILLITGIAALTVISVLGVIDAESLTSTSRAAIGIIIGVAVNVAALVGEYL